MIGQILCSNSTCLILFSENLRLCHLAEVRMQKKGPVLKRGLLWQYYLLQHCSTSSHPNQTKKAGTKQPDSGRNRHCGIQNDIIASTACISDFKNESLPSKEFGEARPFLEAEEGRRDGISTIVVDNNEAITQTRCETKVQIQSAASKIIAIEINKPVYKYLVIQAAGVRAKKINLQYARKQIVITVDGCGANFAGLRPREPRRQRTALLIESAVKRTRRKRLSTQTKATAGEVEGAVQPIRVDGLSDQPSVLQIQSAGLH